MSPPGTIPTRATNSAPPPHSGPLFIPENIAIEKWIALGVFALSMLYLGLFRSYLNLNPDEGNALQGAQRVLQGQVPYLDFFSLVTPGSYYWTALLFKIFGSSLLVARTALMVDGGIFSVLTYLMARRVCSRWAALLAAYSVTLVCLPYRFIVLHNWDSTVLAYLALYCSIRLLEKPHWSGAFSAGTLASMTCLFEQSKGAGLVLGLAIGFGAIVSLTRNHILRFQYLWSFLVGFTLPILITFAYFAWQHSLSLMFAEWFWPLKHYALANTTSYGYLELSSSGLRALSAESWLSLLFILFTMSPFFLIPALPILAVGLLCYWVIRLWMKKGPEDISCHYVLVSATLVGLLLSTLATGRADLHHLLYQAPLFMLVLAWGLDGFSGRLKGVSSIQTMLAFFVFLSFTTLGMAILSEPLRAHSVIQTRHGDFKALKPDLVLEKLQAYVKPGRSIFVYPYQPMYYFLTTTSNPTPFEYLQIGEHTPEQFDEALCRVAVDRTPLVVFQLSFMDVVPETWPSTPVELMAARDKGADFVLSRYRPCETATSMQNWHFVFWVRKDLVCAGPF